MYKCICNKITEKGFKKGLEDKPLKEFLKTFCENSCYSCIKNIKRKLRVVGEDSIKILPLKK